jgi:hypothetical protein
MECVAKTFHCVEETPFAVVHGMRVGAGKLCGYTLVKKAHSTASILEGVTSAGLMSFPEKTADFSRRSGNTLAYFGFEYFFSIQSQSIQVCFHSTFKKQLDSRGDSAAPMSTFQKNTAACVQPSVIYASVCSTTRSNARGGRTSRYLSSAVNHCFQLSLWVLQPSLAALNQCFRLRLCQALATPGPPELRRPCPSTWNSWRRTRRWRG